MWEWIPALTHQLTRQCVYRKKRGIFLPPIGEVKGIKRTNEDVHDQLLSLCVNNLFGEALLQNDEIIPPVCFSLHFLPPFCRRSTYNVGVVLFLCVARIDVIRHCSGFLTGKYASLCSPNVQTGWTFSCEGVINPRKWARNGMRYYIPPSLRL